MVLVVLLLNLFTNLISLGRSLWSIYTPAPVLGHSLSGISEIGANLLNPVFASSRLSQFGSTLDGAHSFFHNAIPMLNVQRSMEGIRKFFDQISVQHPDFYEQYFSRINPMVETMFRYTDGTISDQGSMMFELMVEIAYQVGNFFTPILLPAFKMAQFIVHAAATAI